MDEHIRISDEGQFEAPVNCTGVLQFSARKCSYELAR